MARSWRDYKQVTPPCDNNDNTDKRVASSQEDRAAFVLNVPFVTPLPERIARGLDALGKAAAPRCRHPEHWAKAVADAHRLARDGWAVQALKLGWSDLDLFGGSLDPQADPCCDGLAVWLAGRKILALDGARAIACDAQGSRYYFNRPTAEGARLLWALADCEARDG